MTYTFGPRQRCGRMWTATALVLLVIWSICLSVPAAAGCDDDERPAAPISLKAVPIGSGGITLQWSSNVGHYDIYIRDKAGRPVPEAPDIVGGATSENYHDFFGLQPDKELLLFYSCAHRRRYAGMRFQECFRNGKRQDSTGDSEQRLRQLRANGNGRHQGDAGETMQAPRRADYRRWATSERTQFLYCLEQRRAHLRAMPTLSGREIKTLVACKDHANECGRYRTQAVFAAMRNRFMGCGYKGARWQLNGNAHYAWCMGLGANSSLPWRETRARTVLLNICRDKKASTAQDGGGGGSGTTCAGVPAEWAGMLKAHNDERANFCAAPLTWDCGLADAANTYATKCILNEHGSSAENMADMWK